MNRIIARSCLLIFTLCTLHRLTAQPADTGVRILWNRGGIAGTVEVSNGRLLGLQNAGGKPASGNSFRIAKRQTPELTVRIGGAHCDPGPEPTLITVRTAAQAFSFFLRDVNAQTPVYIPQYGVIVVPQSDTRSYARIEQEIRSRGLSTKRRQIEREPEAAFDPIATRTRNLSVPVWLGLGRDIRMFEITEELQDTPNEDKIIRPMRSSASFDFPQKPGHPVSYRYAVGRGIGALNNIHRWLEEGALPIYHSRMQDDDIVYHTVSFAAPERSELTEEHVKGTHYLLSDAYSPGRVFTEAQQQRLEQLRAGMRMPSEEVVLFSRTEICNTGQVPRYAWVKVPTPGAGLPHAFDYRTGFSKLAEDGSVFCVSQWNGRPMYNEELAVLIQPGETAAFDFRLTHLPIPEERAERLRQRSFEQVYAECRAYWNRKLAAAARIRLPEKRFDEMVRAGLLHLDLNTLGEEPSGPLAAKTGVYSPIGTESAPIIQFYCSMGLTELARKSLDYFIDTQQENGQIMNYYGYTIETGAVLWNVGEYFRYTRDAAWIRQNWPQLVKACDFLIRWREQDGPLIRGKVADPEDTYHQFMLNAYGCLGMSRMAETAQALGMPEAGILKAEAETWRQAIRRAAMESLAVSPAVPMGDGTWSPTLPPWTEAPGPRLLYQQRETFRSHGTFTGPDAGLGPIYLVFCEIFGPEEPLSCTVMEYVAEVMCQGNTGFSQPYYGKLNWWQAVRGDVKPFLNTYYTTVSAHADRETYSFWEHFYRLSPHKTHEEAEFLMETRWMLYLERGDTLHLFRTIPRAWLEAGKEIALDNVHSYFGPLNTRATGLKEGRLEAVVTCPGDRKPRCVTLRLPHPEGLKPRKVTGGVYLPESESLLIDDFDGEARIILEFD